jgi:hypothetical protein
VKGFGAELDPSGNWMSGMYFMSEFQRTALVAIDQLPVNPNTLWLRVLGRGTTQQQAIQELLTLKIGNPFRNNLLEILSNWRINIQLRQNQDEENQELIMNLSPAYYQWREEAVQEGRREIVENSFRVRFGEIDEELSSTIEPLLQLPVEDLTRFVLTLSRDELVQRFGTPG